VRERHEQQRARSRRRADVVERDRAVEREVDEVAVRQLDTLGPSGRARRVDDRGQVGRARQRHAAGDLRVVDTGTRRHECREGVVVQDPDVGEVRQVAAHPGD
jgi:hypothetical protein